MALAWRFGLNHDASHLVIHSGYRASIIDHGEPAIQLQRDGVTVAQEAIAQWDRRQAHLSLAVQGDYARLADGDGVEWTDSDILINQNRDRYGFVSWCSSFHVPIFTSTPWVSCVPPYLTLRSTCDKDLTTANPYSMTHYYLKQR